jgi:hypothetical protein
MNNPFATMADLNSDRAEIRETIKEVFREQMLPVTRILRELLVERTRMSESRFNARIEEALNLREEEDETEICEAFQEDVSGPEA